MLIILIFLVYGTQLGKDSKKISKCHETNPVWDSLTLAIWLLQKDLSLTLFPRGGGYLILPPKGNDYCV